MMWTAHDTDPLTRSGRVDREADELVDKVAIEDFDSAHSEPVFGPIAVVIAAYKEAATIGQVIDGIPARIGGLEVSVLVVVDGEEDGTAATVRGLGRYACVAQVNRGQGAALRLGYRIARDHGARFVVTADADGQTDPSDLAVVLAPVIAGELDFANGSRRLGKTLSHDLVRNTGVVVFAAIASLLTRTKITDTANPVRAMRAEITAVLELDEPQYQASELLIGAIMRGYRFGELPVTMRARAGGSSKKGHPLVYGYRYGRVMFRTWLRERRRPTG